MSQSKKNPTQLEVSHQQFNKLIFPLELEQIAQRQEGAEGGLSAGLADSSKPPAEIKFGGDEQTPPKSTRFKDVAPSTELELVGLALSGGGIRSATFNLGVIQVLAENGIFQQADYLSTVSGGGYFGGSLSSVFNKKASANAKGFPFGVDDRGEERKAVKHLRNSSNYLAPRGWFDYIRIPALLLRGILLNFLVLFPYLVLAVWITRWFLGDCLKDEQCHIYFYPALGSAILFVVWTVLSPLIQSLFTGFSKSFTWRNRFERSFSFILMAVFGFTLIGLALAALSAYHHLENSGSEIIQAIRNMPIWSAAAAVIPFLFAGKASENISKLRGKLGLLALGVLAPLLLFWVYLGLADWGIFHPDQTLFSIPWLDWVAFSRLAILVWLFTFLFVDMNKTSLHSFYRDRLSKAYLIQVDDDGGKESIPHNDTQKLSELNSGCALAPYHLINTTLNLQASENPDLRGRNADFFLFSKHAVGSSYTGYCATRDLEAIDSRLDLGTAIAISGAAAAPNMGRTTIKPLVGIMTLLNVRLGRWLPNPRNINDKNIPNRLFSLGAGPLWLFLEFLGRNDEKKSYVNVSDGGHVENLGIYELLRRRCKFIIASDAEADVNLSFGGLATLIRHAFIDMGIEIVMELEEVRRSTTGLSRKKCALGKIRYPKAGNRRGETGHLLYIKSSISGAEAEYIREYRTRNTAFPHESTGDQFFDEMQFEAYRALGYDSAKSLFQEQGAFNAKTDSEPQQMSVEKWFEELTVLLRPRFPMHDKFTDLQKQLSAVEREFGAPEIAAYTYQIYPEINLARKEDTAFGKSLDPRLTEATATGEAASAFETHGDKATDDERFRKIFHLCNLQMQLMENAFMDLELDREQYREHYFNRGWMNLFRRWSQAAYFRRTWAVTIGTYSVGFQKFCEDALKLEAKIIWRRDVGWDYLTQREQEYLRERNLYDAAGQPHGADYQIWVACMCDSQIVASDDSRDSFPIGMVVLDIKDAGAVPELLFYRIRDYYRQMKLFERMLRTLQEELAQAQQLKSALESADKLHEPQALKPVVKLLEKDIALYAYIFRRSGFRVELKLPQVPVVPSVPI